MFYSQRDPRWGNKIIGESRSSAIWQHGSMLTAMANLLHVFKHDRLPDELNDEFIQRKWFNEDEIINLRAPADLFPAVLQLAGEKHWREDQEADLSKMADAGDPNVAYIITIEGGPVAGDTKYTALVDSFTASLKGMDLILIDSIDGQKRALSTYGQPNKILRAAYRFKRASTAPIPETQNNNLWVTLDDIDTLTDAFFGTEPTDTDYQLEGNSWRHVVMTFIADPRFRQPAPFTYDQAVDILRAIHKEDPTEEQINDFLESNFSTIDVVQNHFHDITRMVEEQPNVNNQPTEEQIMDIIRRKQS